jgi:hypothetical protein
MSVFKTTFSRALTVFQSNDAVIPNPALYVSGGNNTDTNPFELIDANADFLTQKVYPGDVVYNVSSQSYATVVSVDNSGQLTLNADIFLVIDEGYAIYAMSSQAGMGQTGCYLYIGGAGGDVAVITIGGEEVTFFSVPTGTVLPVQVRKIPTTGTSPSNIVALW